VNEYVLVKVYVMDDAIFPRSPHVKQYVIRLEIS
jgi:hypothetical protein